MKHIIWNNDICEMAESIRECPEEYFEDSDVENLSDEKIFEEANDSIQVWLEDEVGNLDETLQGTIILTGTLQRWDGPRSVYKDLKTKNVGESIQKALACFEGDNLFEVYVEDGKMYISQTGHDNPTNPSIFEFKLVNSDEMDSDDFDSNRDSKSIGLIPCEVYGWEEEETIA